MEKTDILIIGAGVVGLAIANELSGQGRDVLVIEKNDGFGRETSSRNSEVIHSGIYYPKGSLKTGLCIRGRELIYDVCRKHNINFKKLGKILLSTNKKESAKIKAIFNNAAECGVSGLKYLSRDELRKLEPDVKADEAILCPETGILDTHGFMSHLYTSAKAKGAEFAFGVSAQAIEKYKEGYKVSVREPGGEPFSFDTRIVINCAGLYSDKVAAMTGLNIDKAGDPQNVGTGVSSYAGYKIHFCKGQYFRIADPKKFNITRLLYPPPTDISLGIHVTPDLAGGLRLGPDAFYVDDVDYKVNTQDAEKFYLDVKKYLPGLRIKDLIPDTSGVRPKLHGKEINFSDFVIRHEGDRGFPGFINLIGIESPGFTASLGIAELINSMLKKVCLV